MKKSLIIIFLLAVVKLVIQLMGNRNYGFHRDELLHLSVSEHLDWGFMEFPPFIGFVGRLSYFIFDYSLTGTRLFPTLAGVGIVILCGLMARELKGGLHSVFLAGICILAFLPFYRNHTLFQPVAFDQLFWSLGFYYILRFINTDNRLYLILTGLTLGVGLMNKYTMLIWALGVFVGMIFYKKGVIFKNKWWYISGFISLTIVLPNIIWQFQNDIPLIRHIEQLNESHLSQLNVFEFGLDQLAHPLTFIVSIIGVVYLIGKSSYRPLGIAALVIFFVMWSLQAKSYYVFALYPVLLAAGSVQITSWLKEKSNLWVYLIALLLLAGTIPFIPSATPLLSIDNYLNYADIQEEDGRVQLSGDYADMFGWEEQVRLVDSVYQSLSAEERSNCVLWAENYGEAGALKILGKKYNLPNPISRHGSFWSWGPGNPDAQVWISLGNETPAVENIFADVQLVRMITHKYAIGEENGIPLYICRHPKQNIEKWWADFEPYIFQ